VDQTPINVGVNGDLLLLVPDDALKIVEIGCSGGGLAREYRKRNASCEYIGVEINASYAEVARPYCTRVVIGDIENMSEDLFSSFTGSRVCWVFGDVLEHLYDPWALLKRIRASVAPDSSVLACIPNAQHWSVQAKLNCGAFRYEEKGLLDRTHIRWFTRTTIDEMFQECGYVIVEGRCRIFDEPHRDAALAGIRAFAGLIGADADKAAMDATPLQYVVRAMPI